MSSLEYFGDARRRALAFAGGLSASAPTEFLRADALAERASFIHATRFVAALIVAGAHLRSAMFVDYKAVAAPPIWFAALATLSGFAGDAVMVFFVISGWLVGGSLLDARKSKHVYRDYAIARTRRLWSVMLPLFLIQAMLHPAQVPDLLGPYGAVTLAGNLLGLQTVWTSFFGGNFPLWSLANETAYYVSFALLLAVFDCNLSTRRRAICLATLCAYAAILTPSIRLYFVIWLIGALATRAPLGQLRFRAAVRHLSGTVFFLLVLYKRYYGHINEISYDIASSVSFAVLLATLPIGRTAPGANTRVARLAGFSFSLYVLHVPLIYWFDLQDAARADVSLARLGEYLARLSFILLASFLYGQAFEQRHQALRGWIIGCFHASRERPPERIRWLRAK